LQSFFLPSSLEVIDSRAFDLPFPDFFPSDRCHFSVQNDCLVRLDDHKLIRYMGDSPTFCFGPDISIVSQGSFAPDIELQHIVSNSSSRLQRPPAGAFSNCSHLRSVTVPKSVLAIGGHCFWCCDELTTVCFEFPARIRRIDFGAFFGCSNLTSFTIPSSVSTLGKSVFRGCKKLTSVKFDRPSQITNIPDQLFFVCRRLAIVDLPDSLVTIAGSAFIETSLHSLTARGFAMAGPLFMQFQKVVRYFGVTKSVVIPSTVREIGESAFANTYFLEDLSFEEGVQQIKSSAFYGCPRLNAVSFPASLVAIEERAFYDSGLRRVTFAADSKLQYIGMEAFLQGPLRV
jgi:hypothetical protein